LSSNVRLPAPLDYYNRQNEAETRQAIERAFLGLPDAGAVGSAETLLDIDGAYEAIDDGGLVGNGSTDDRAALNTLANTTIPAGGGTIVFGPGTYKIGSDLTLPDKVTLAFRRGAMLSLDTGVAVTIKSEIVAGPWQIFTGATVGVRFATSADAGNVGRTKTYTYRPEWWGAIADNSTDCYTAIQRCRDAVSGYPFFSHVEKDRWTAASGTNTTVTVTSAGWCPNQWQGATLRIYSGTGSGETLFRIASNTSDTITIDGYYTGDSNSWTYNAGNFTNGAGAPGSGSVIHLSLAAAAVRWARGQIEYGPGLYVSTKCLHWTNTIGAREIGQGVDLTNIKTNGGQTTQTATSGTTTTLTRTGAGWTVDQWRNYWVGTTGGTGLGQAGWILSNTTDTLTFVTALATAPDSTTTYVIMPEAITGHDGWWQGQIDGMTLTAQNAGTMFGFYYHRNPDKSARGSSTSRIDNVWINGPTWYSAWQFGGYGYYSPWQEDNPTSVNIRADGGWAHGGVAGQYYQYGAFFGTGTAGNNLNHLVKSLHLTNYRSLVSCSRTNVWIDGFTSGPAKYGFEINLGTTTHATVKNWRAETVEELIYSPSIATNSTAQCGMSLRNVWVPDWRPAYDSSIGYAALVRWIGYGQLEIDDLHVDQAYGLNSQTTSSGTTTTLTVAGTPWTVNAYTGYTWIGKTGTGRGQKVQITSNTNNTLTFASALDTAPDATTVWDAYLIPTIYVGGSGNGLVRAYSCHFMGGDFQRSFVSSGGGSVIEVMDFNPLHHRTGGLRNKTISGPWRVSAIESHTQATSGFAFGESAAKPDTFFDRVGVGRLGISALETPYLKVKAMGATTTLATVEKIGAHSGGATTYNYKIVAKVRGDTNKRALVSSAMTVTNCLAALTEDEYVRFGAPTPLEPIFCYDLLKDIAGTYEVFDNGEALLLEELYHFKDIGQPTRTYTLPTTDETGRLEVEGALVEAVETLTYGATISTDMNLGNTYLIGVTNNTAFTISNPTNGTIGQRLTYSIKNTSGGAMGAITWGSEFKMAGAFTNPANNTWRSITFERETSSAWVERNRNAADVA